MMDFLRSLAPPRAGDGSRAVALLPTPFGAVAPLRAPMRRPAPEPEADGSLALDSTAAPAGPAPHSVAGPLRAVASVPPAPSTAPEQGAAPTAPADHEARPVGRSRAAVAASAGEFAGLVSAPAGPPRSAGERASIDTPAQPPPGTPVPALAAEYHGSPAPFVAHRLAPLSAASLGLRVAKPLDEPAAVHVSIGRIEVVANVAPQPTARRAAPPRQPAVALADYLRGEQGGRR